MDAATIEQMAEHQFNPGMVNNIITITNILTGKENNISTITKTTKIALHSIALSKNGALHQVSNIHLEGDELVWEG